MKYAILTLIATLALSSQVLAQGQGGGGGAGGGGGGGGGGRPAGGGGGGSSAGGNASAGSNTNLANAGIEAGSPLGAFNNTGQGSRNSAVSSSNPFANYYGNPYVIGSTTGTTTAAPFGSPVFGGTSGGSGGNFSGGGGGGFGNRTNFGATGGGAGSGGTGRTSTGSLGTTSAPGGNFNSFSNAGATGANRTGAGGFGGTAGLSSGGNVAQLFAPQAPSGLRGGILYSTTMKFKVNPPSADERRTEVRNIVARSSTISVPQGVNVDYDGGVVVLKGQVADDDERRHVENLVRLSPGVRDVRNELSVR